MGTGKTTVAKTLAKKLHFIYLDVNGLIKKNKSVVVNYDELRKTKEIDVNKLNKILLTLIKENKKGIVIDSHLSHYLPSKIVDICIVCRCNLKTLKKRLEKRKYSSLKIQENLEAEIFDVCLVDALEAGHNVEIIQTDKNMNQQLNNLLKKI